MSRMTGYESQPEPEQNFPGPTGPAAHQQPLAAQTPPAYASVSSTPPTPPAPPASPSPWGYPGNVPPMTSLMPPMTPIDPYTQNPIPSRRKPRRTGLVFAMIGTVLASGAVGGTAGALASHHSATPSAAATSSSGAVSPVSDKSGSTATPSSTVGAVAKAVLPSVVQVTVTTYQGKELGSGVILTADGTILTNNHVISSAANGGGTLTVTLNNGKTVDATIVGADSSSDLAIIKATGVSGLTPATLGDSSTVQVGDTVVAIGSPEGLQGTVTSGIVSALNRSVTVGTGSNSPYSQNSDSVTYNAIQTDASINPGNSGGPLLNAAGQVIGINSAIYSPTTSYTGQGGSVGLGFSIPINQVKTIIAKLEGGYQG
jgi:putative serine protease PepD